jgi:hypothetical protein
MIINDNLLRANGAGEKMNWDQACEQAMHAEKNMGGDSRTKKESNYESELGQAGFESR